LGVTTADIIGYILINQLNVYMMNLSVTFMLKS